MTIHDDHIALDRLRLTIKAGEVGPAGRPEHCCVVEDVARVRLLHQSVRVVLQQEALGDGV
jgi:hypothetical protein